MLDEVVECMAPAPGRVLVDLTLGGAGHARSLLERGATVIGFDRDEVAVRRAQSLVAEFAGRFVPVHRDFGSYPEVLDDLGHEQVDGLLMDLGLSSDQLDDPARGFAFRLAGPLDLRFDRDRGLPAWRVVSDADARTIEGWLREYGEVRAARRLARDMVRAAGEDLLRTTDELAALVRAAVPASKRPEPEAARVFQALRIVVNEELVQLERALEAVPGRLRAGGRFVAISYHSLEDRRVKRMLRELSGRASRGSRHLPPVDEPEPTLVELTRKPMTAGEDEVACNPRARSARLRAGERR